jgi:RNA polymerase sigma factor (sigma-70 family)
MTSGPDGAVLRQFEQLFTAGTVAGLGEGQLLERFVARRDEAAFAALVARHGPMVLGVCRGLLFDPNDVEDAFQATFLVLVERAGAIRDRDLLGPWLYGVALRVAARARAVAMRRRAREHSGAPELAAEEAADELDRDELRAALHEELARLPEKYRTPVVLCHLEGKTHDEAARQLRWPVGTVRGRLSRARALLRERLTRRGAAPVAAGLGVALGREARAVPPSLADATVEAALRTAAGRMTAAGAVSASAAALSRGVLRTMLLSKLKLIAAVLAAAGLLAAGAGVRAYQDRAPAPRPELPKDAGEKKADLAPPTPVAPESPAPAAGADLPAPSNAVPAPSTPASAPPRPEASPDAPPPAQDQPPAIPQPEREARLEPISGPPVTAPPDQPPPPANLQDIEQFLAQMPSEIDAAIKQVSAEITDLSARLKKREAHLQQLKQIQKALTASPAAGTINRLEPLVPPGAGQPDLAAGVVPLSNPPARDLPPPKLEGSLSPTAGPDPFTPRNPAGSFPLSNPPTAGRSGRPDPAAPPGPSTVKPGDLIQIEVLEALPGRPISGERRVRPDGTISLGFYGDLPVAGLTRTEIKEKLIQHLRKHLKDETLGLVEVGEDGKERRLDPKDSDRVFVDDAPHPDGDAQRRLELVERKLDRLLKELEGLKHPPRRE